MKLSDAGCEGIALKQWPERAMVSAGFIINN